MIGTNVNNQTNPQWLENVRPADKGTGIFAIPDVESGEPGAAKVVRVSGISYPDCVQRGLFAMAFKWIPDSVARELPETTCGEEFGVDHEPSPGDCLFVLGRCLKAT